MIINGDCIEEMKKMGENSVDSIITDPPYGISILSKKWDNFDPKHINDKTTNHLPIDHKKQTGRCASMHAGNYDHSPIASKQYQEWCQEWGIEALRVIKPGGHILSFCSTRMYHRQVSGLEDAGWQIRDTISWIFGSGFPKGENLKPAQELIVLARKPLGEKTIKGNIIEYGTGGLNIDECRIPLQPGEDIGDSRNDGVPLYPTGEWGFTRQARDNNDRYPANVIIDEFAGELLDKQSGISKPKKGRIDLAGKRSNPFLGGCSIKKIVCRWPGDNGGGASRFFYCPKISKRERNEGCENIAEQQQNSDTNIRTYNDRCKTCKKKFIGPDDKICHCPPGKKITDKTVYKNRNSHPTVKPILLMQYLIKLITPSNGTVLDPFAGSGSTGCAALKLGFDFIGIEKSKEYCTIAEARIERCKDNDIFYKGDNGSATS